MTGSIQSGSVAQAPQVRYQLMEVPKKTPPPSRSPRNRRKPYDTRKSPRSPAKVRSPQRPQPTNICQRQGPRKSQSDYSCEKNLVRGAVVYLHEGTEAIIVRRCSTGEYEIYIPSVESNFKATRDEFTVRKPEMGNPQGNHYSNHSPRPPMRQEPEAENVARMAHRAISGDLSAELYMNYPNPQSPGPQSPRHIERLPPNNYRTPTRLGPRGGEPHQLKIQVVESVRSPQRQSPLYPPQRSPNRPRPALKPQTQHSWASPRSTPPRAQARPNPHPIPVEHHPTVAESIEKNQNQRHQRPHPRPHQEPNHKRRSSPNNRQPGRPQTKRTPPGFPARQREGNGQGRKVRNNNPRIHASRNERSVPTHISAREAHQSDMPSKKPNRKQNAVRPTGTDKKPRRREREMPERNAEDSSEEANNRRDREETDFQNKCRHFMSPEGCRRGGKCRFYHPGETTKANKSSGCRIASVSVEDKVEPTFNQSKSRGRKGGKAPRQRYEACDL